MNVITGTYVETVSRQAADLKTRAQRLFQRSEVCFRRLGLDPCLMLFSAPRSGESSDKRLLSSGQMVLVAPEDPTGAARLPSHRLGPLGLHLLGGDPQPDGHQRGLGLLRVRGCGPLGGAVPAGGLSVELYQL